MQVSTDWKIKNRRPECKWKHHRLGTTKTHLDLRQAPAWSLVFCLLPSSLDDMIVYLEEGLKNRAALIQNKFQPTLVLVRSLIRCLKALITTWAWDYENSTQHGNISAIKYSICFQVVVGLSCFLFPGGDHQWPTLGRYWSIWRTRPSHQIPSTTFRAIFLLVQVLVGNLFWPKHETYLTLHLFPLTHSPAFWALQQDWFSIAFFTVVAVLLGFLDALRTCECAVFWHPCCINYPFLRAVPGM